MCVCVRERGRERESVCVCLSLCVCLRACLCVCVLGGGGGGLCVCTSVEGEPLYQFPVLAVDIFDPHSTTSVSKIGCFTVIGCSTVDILKSIPSTSRRITNVL